MNPKYPIFIISKGRSDYNHTARTLEYMRVPYKLVIEPQELVKYASQINSKNIITTPFSNLGQGSIPVRNFVWDLAKQMKVERYWIMDDNIKYFYRLNRNLKVVVNDGTMIRCLEDFVDRYTNIKMAGLQYDYFAPRKQKMNPFVLNTRIYSCILLSTDIKHRWRGRYNEDTDLSIRILKDGWCTILFNALLCGKAPTLTTKGGNAAIYNQTDNRREFAESLKRQHPDIVEVVQKYNRWHHLVDYSGFKNNTPILKKGIKIKEGVDEYGMQLIHFKENSSIFNGK